MEEREEHITILSQYFAEEELKGICTKPNYDSAVGYFTTYAQHTNEDLLKNPSFLWLVQAAFVARTLMLSYMFCITIRSAIELSLQGEDLLFKEIAEQTNSESRDLESARNLLEKLYEQN